MKLPQRKRPFGGACWQVWGGEIFVWGALPPFAPTLSCCPGSYCNDTVDCDSDIAPVNHEQTNKTKSAQSNQFLEYDYFAEQYFLNFLAVFVEKASVRIKNRTGVHYAGIVRLILHADFLYEASNLKTIN